MDHGPDRDLVCNTNDTRTRVGVHDGRYRRPSEEQNRKKIDGKTVLQNRIWHRDRSRSRIFLKK